MAKGRKSPIQMHHIRYGHEVMPEWKIALKMWMHRAVTLLARLNPTEEHYVLAMNFLHAIMQVCNDMRLALDTKTDNFGHPSQRKYYE